MAERLYDGARVALVVGDVLAASRRAARDAVEGAAALRAAHRHLESARADLDVARRGLAVARDRRELSRARLAAARARLA